jgi:biofilm PGA synthesis N-glycosyltransferase PgaC
VRADRAVGGDPRNVALAAATTPLVVSVAAGACLHPSAVRLLVARLESCGADTVAVAGHALTRNRRDGTPGELLAVDFASELDAAQRTEGLFGGPLVADGSCTVFRTEALRAVNGWPPVEASDVVVTCRFLERGWRAVHEPLAIAFTTELVTLGSSGRRRALAARGLRAAGRESGSGAYRLAERASRVQARVDRVAPVLDVAFTIAWLQALLLVFAGQLALVAAYLVLVAPLTLAGVALERRYHREVLDEAGLVLAPTRAVRGSPLLSLLAVQAPAAVWERLRDAHAPEWAISRPRLRLGWRARPYA